MNVGFSNTDPHVAVTGGRRPPSRARLAQVIRRTELSEWPTWKLVNEVLKLERQKAALERRLRLTAAVALGEARVVSVTAPKARAKAKARTTGPASVSS